MLSRLLPTAAWLHRSAAESCKSAMRRDHQIMLQGGRGQSGAESLGADADRVDAVMASNAHCIEPRGDEL